MTGTKIPPQLQKELDKLDCKPLTVTTSHCKPKVDESVINPSNAVHSAQTFLICMLFLGIMLALYWLKSRPTYR